MSRPRGGPATGAVVQSRRDATPARRSRANRHRFALRNSRRRRSPRPLPSIDVIGLVPAIHALAHDRARIAAKSVARTQERKAQERKAPRAAFPDADRP
jgi:hypothetical protein